MCKSVSKPRSDPYLQPAVSAAIAPNGAPRPVGAGVLMGFGITTVPPIRMGFLTGTPFNIAVEVTKTVAPPVPIGRMKTLLSLERQRRDIGAEGLPHVVPLR